MNAELTKELGIVNRTNESLAASLRDSTKESLLKTELLRTLSEGITGKNGLDKAV